MPIIIIAQLWAYVNNYLKKIKKFIIFVFSIKKRCNRTATQKEWRRSEKIPFLEVSQAQRVNSEEE